MTTEPGLRERKKQRTRQALIDAAAELFDRKGYEQTTIAEIAAAADVAPRTVFSYFASKEELLFADTESRLQLALAEIDRRTPDERPADVLLRIVRSLADPDQQATVGLLTPMARIRVQLIFTTPLLQGYALRRLFSVQQEIADHLHRAFADEFDRVTVAAMVGSFVGALMGAAMAWLGGLDGAAHALEEGPERLLPALAEAAGVAIDGIAALG